jgi:anaerobic magnesium-protoporphyrin IX monomethyl ester cyclase
MFVLWPVYKLEKDYSQYPGIMNISAVLKQNGVPTEVVSADLRSVRKKLEANGNVIVAYSTTSAYSNFYLDFNREVKKEFPRAFSVFGGAHPTFFPEIIEEEGVDGVCVGEGEFPLLELAEARDKDAPITSLQNWWIKDGAVVHRNPVRPLIEDLDQLPIPDRDIFRNAAQRRLPHAIVMTGRGCPYGCTYCYNHVYRKLYTGKGKIVRRRSVEHVMQELHQIKAEGCRFIRFMDDLFILYPEWVREFATRYREEIGLPFSCLVRANLVTEEIVASLKEAGCHRIMMGIEAGNDRLRNEILKRNMSREEILEAGKIVRAAGIRLVTANILAIPGGSLEADWETVDLNLEVRPSYGSAAVLQPFPGTEIHEIAASMDLLDEDHLVKGAREEFGFSTVLKSRNEGEMRQVVNLHKLFPLVVWFPFLKPLVRQLIKLPPNKVFEVFYMICINIGTHLISIPAGVGGPMLLRKLGLHLQFWKRWANGRAEVAKG